MTQYLISFNDGAMVIPDEDLPEVSRAAMAVVREAMAAGVFIFGGGLLAPALTSVVATDGTVTQGPNPAYKDFIGGFTIVEVPTPEEAYRWAAKLAESCRCAQDVREFGLMPDATSH